MNEMNIPDKYKPLSAWAYLGYSLLFSIPLIGIILAIVFALSDENINRRNFARFNILLIVLSVVLVIAMIVLEILLVGSLAVINGSM